MDQIQEYNNSIYYVQDYKLIEFNLLSKNKYLHRVINKRKSFSYDVLAPKLIGYMIYKSYYLNNRLLLDNINRVLILQTKPIDGTIGHKFIVADYMRGDYDLEFYNLDGIFIKKIQNTEFWKIDDRHYHQLHVSYDGQIITWDIDNKIRIIDLDINMTTNKTFQKYNLDFNIGHTRWLRNSSRLVIINMTHIVNIHTKAILKIKKELKYFDTSNDIMIGLEYQMIQIYDVRELKNIKQIQHDYEFAHYHKKLNILITRSCELFVITSCYKLKRAIIGINYVIDNYKFPNSIMDIVVDSVTMFELLPNEIIFTEVYRMILKHCML